MKAINWGVFVRVCYSMLGVSCEFEKSLACSVDNECAHQHSSLRVKLVIFSDVGKEGSGVEVHYHYCYYY